MIKTTAIFLFVLLLPCFAHSQSWENFTTQNSSLTSNNVKAICLDGNGVKWFGTENGLVSYNGSQWQSYKSSSEKNSLAHNRVNDIAFEVSEYGPELWLATDNGVSVMGIQSFDAVTFATPYRTDNTELIANQVLTTAVDPGHVRWFGTLSGVSSFSGSNWSSYSTANFWIYHNRVMTIETGPDSMVYIGTEGAGVTHGMKNLVGTLPVPAGLYNVGASNRTGIHQIRKYDGNPDSNLCRVILDINNANPIHLVVNDAIHTVLGGEGPWNSGIYALRLADFNRLIVSKDPVAADSIATKIIGYDPMAEDMMPPYRTNINYLKLAAEMGMGNYDLAKIKIVGEPV